MKRVTKFVLNLPIAMIVLSSYFIATSFLKNDVGGMILLGILWLGFLLGHWYEKKTK